MQTNLGTEGPARDDKSRHGQGGGRAYLLARLVHVGLADFLPGFEELGSAVETLFVLTGVPVEARARVRPELFLELGESVAGSGQDITAEGRDYPRVFGTEEPPEVGGADVFVLLHHPGPFLQGLERHVVFVLLGQDRRINPPRRLGLTDDDSVTFE